MRKRLQTWIHSLVLAGVAIVILSGLVWSGHDLLWDGSYDNAYVMDVDDWLTPEEMYLLVVEQDRQRSGFIIHQIEQGETLWSLARRYELELDTLVQTNELVSPDLIRSGDELLIPATDGLMYRVGDDETAFAVARRFGVPLIDVITASNSLDDEVSVFERGDRLFLPGVSVQSQAGSIAGTGPRLLWPVLGRISSGFGPRWGRMHYGIDIVAVRGTPVRAAESGYVKSAGWKGGYGQTVVVEHECGLVSLYGHLSEIHVRRGQIVQRGDRIGLVGSTGNSTGPHLHFEVRVDGEARDPIRYLTAHSE